MDLIINRWIWSNPHSPTNGHPITRFGNALVLKDYLHMTSLEGQVQGLAEVVVGAVRLEQPGLDDPRGQHIVRVPGIASRLESINETFIKII